MRRFALWTIASVIFMAACSAVGPPVTGPSRTPVTVTSMIGTVLPETVGPPATEGPSPTPVPATPIPTLPSASFSSAELKYQVLEQFPDFFFCDPDLYPVARDDEKVLAQQRFPELQANQEEFQAILSHNSLAGTTTFTDEQKLLLYREHKKLNAIYFELVGDQYQFQIQTGLDGQQGAIITGTIDASGTIEIQKQEASIPTCPICLAAGTLIDTPSGAVSVEDLQAGDQVWTMNEAGERVATTILRTARVRVLAVHQIVHVILDDGRELLASPGHPTADGRTLGDLKAGDVLDGARIILAEGEVSEGVFTYDVLPSGETGFYWADGILLGSTLFISR